MNLPNAITVARILACPLIAVFTMSPTLWSRYIAFILFVLAALSDLWDGYLARKHGLVTVVGKILDPIADKLLLASTLIPLYIVGDRAGDVSQFLFWGTLPMWVLIVVFGREIFITLFRSYALRRGVVISAARSGKFKALMQNFFIGGLLLWYPLSSSAEGDDWTGALWEAWSGVHSLWIGVTLLAAVVLTVFSMFDYIWSYRSLVTSDRL